VSQSVSSNGEIKLKGVKNFSHSQRRKKSVRGGQGGGSRGGNGGGRQLQDEESTAGIAVIVTTEDISAYQSINGVTKVERDTELSIDSLRSNFDPDVVKKYIGDLDRAQSGRKLQETRPWGIDLVNVTQLWDVSLLPCVEH